MFKYSSSSFLVGIVVLAFVIPSCKNSTKCELSFNEYYEKQGITYGFDMIHNQHGDYCACYGEYVDKGYTADYASTNCGHLNKGLLPVPLCTRCGDDGFVDQKDIDRIKKYDKGAEDWSEGTCKLCGK